MRALRVEVSCVTCSNPVTAQAALLVTVVTCLSTLIASSVAQGLFGLARTRIRAASDHALDARFGNAIHFCWSATVNFKIKPGEVSGY